jgi:hypothetical protein
MRWFAGKRGAEAKVSAPRWAGTTSQAEPTAAYVLGEPALVTYLKQHLEPRSGGRYGVCPVANEKTLRQALASAGNKLWLVQLRASWREYLDPLTNETYDGLDGFEPVTTLLDRAELAQLDSGQTKLVAILDRPGVTTEEEQLLSGLGFHLYVGSQTPPDELLSLLDQIPWSDQRAEEGLEDAAPTPWPPEASQFASSRSAPGSRRAPAWGSDGHESAAAPPLPTSGRARQPLAPAAPAASWDAADLVDADLRTGGLPLRHLTSNIQGGTRRQPTLDEAQATPPRLHTVSGPTFRSTFAPPTPRQVSAWNLPEAEERRMQAPLLPPGAAHAMPTAPDQEEEPTPPLPKTTSPSLAPPPMTSAPVALPREPAAPVQTRGLLAFWGPDAGDQRALVALNLALWLRGQGVKALVGEFARPSAGLALHLGLDELPRSLLVLAQHTAEFRGQTTVDGYLPYLRDYLFVGGLTPPGGGEVLPLFLSAAPAEEVPLMREATFSSLLPILFKRLEHWPYRLGIVGSSLTDPLHLETLQACDRLVLCLTPDPLMLDQAGMLVPNLLASLGLDRSNVDVLLLQANRGLSGLAEEAQGSAQSALHRQYTRALAARLDRVEGLLKRWKLDGCMLGQLPDLVPLLERFQARCASQTRTLLNYPEVLQSHFGQGIGQIAQNWVAAGKAKARK